MKSLSVTTVFSINVNDSVNPEELSLAIPLEQIQVMGIDGEIPAKCVGYTTFDVFDNERN